MGIYLFTIIYPIIFNRFSLKKVDWVPMLTRDFMDDFASHLRLYRKAKEKVQIQRDNLLKVDDLESVFFDYELEMEKSYCRDLVSTSAQYESGKYNEPSFQIYFI